MSIYLEHYYCLISELIDNNFLFLRWIFLNFSLMIYGWKRSNILNFKMGLSRQVLRYTQITITEIPSYRISWNFDMFYCLLYGASVQSFKKIHRRKREKNTPKSELMLLSWQNIDSTWSVSAHAFELQCVKNACFLVGFFGNFIVSCLSCMLWNTVWNRYFLLFETNIQDKCSEYKKRKHYSSLNWCIVHQICSCC